MEPIISPWMFYFIDMIAPVRKTIAVILFLSIVAFISRCIIADNEDKLHFVCARWCKKIVAVAIVCTLLLCIIPTRDTAYKMLIASYVTPNNIEATSEGFNKLLDTITEKAIQIKEAGNK